MTEKIVAELTDRGAAVEYRFPSGSRVVAPMLVGVSTAALMLWATAGRSSGVAMVLIGFAALLFTASEVYRRSFCVRVVGPWLEDVDLLTSRRLPLQQLQQVRVYRNRRVWLIFGRGAKPVCILRGMGRPVRVVETILTHARQAGASPEVVDV